MPPKNFKDFINNDWVHFLEDWKDLKKKVEFCSNSIARVSGIQYVLIALVIAILVSLWVK